MKRIRRVTAAIWLAAMVVLCAPQAQAQASAAADDQAAAAKQETAQAYQLPPDKLAQAVEVSRLSHLLYFAGWLWAIGFVGWMVVSSAAARLEAWVERRNRRRWLQGVIYFTAGLAVFMVCVYGPVAAIGHTISRHFGISVEGWGVWSADFLKLLILAIVIGTPVLLLLNWIVRRWPRRYWLVGWLATTALTILGAIGEPLLEPVFNHFEPLSNTNPALAAKLEEVTQKTGINIPLDRMYLMQASTKTNGLNAYVSGLGATKRIVVWDTTAGRVPDDQVMFIFGHESGHYVLHHMEKGLVLASTIMFFGFWLCSRLAEMLLRRRGQRWRIASLASRAGFTLLAFVVLTANFFNEPLANGASRYYEHQADVYGQEAIHGLVPNPQATAVKAFNALGAAWLDEPNPNKFVEFWEYDHPSTEERATFAEHYAPWADGGHGRFFKR